MKRLAKHSHDPELARITAGSFGPDAWHHVRRSSAQKALPGSKARPAVQQTPQLPKGDASTAKRMKASGCSDDHGYLPIMQLLDILKETGSNPAGSQLPVSVRNKETSTRIHGGNLCRLLPFPLRFPNRLPAGAPAGVFHFGTGESTHWVYCNCDSCSALDSQQRMFRPAEFERHCGRLSSKKWKLTIQAWLPNGLQSVPSLGLGIGEEPFSPHALIPSSLASPSLQFPFTLGSLNGCWSCACSFAQAETVRPMPKPQIHVRASRLPR